MLFFAVRHSRVWVLLLVPVRFCLFLLVVVRVWFSLLVAVRLLLVCSLCFLPSAGLVAFAGWAFGVCGCLAFFFPVAVWLSVLVAFRV